MTNTTALQTQSTTKDPFASPAPQGPRPGGDGLAPPPGPTLASVGAGAGGGPGADAAATARLFGHFADDAAPAAVQRSPAPTTGAGADQLEALRGVLGGPKVTDKEALAAWGKVDDKGGAPEELVALAISKLGAPAGHRILQESGRGFTAAIVDAILKRRAGWDKALHGEVEAIATCPDDEPRARLRELLKADGKRGGLLSRYKPQLAQTLGSGTTLALGQAAQLTATDEGWLRFHKGLPGVKAPTFHWKLSADEEHLGPAPASAAGAETRAPTATYPFHPKRAGVAKVTVELSAFTDDCFAGKDSHTYSLSVIDAAADPAAYFEGRFRDGFGEILGAGPFAEAKDKPGGLAGLFSKAQQEDLLGYLDTKIVPPGLFTNEPANKATGPQRILIASHLLTHGKIRLGDKVLDGQKWCASCCGGWVNGVWAYAGTNAAAGYGSLSSEQSISPTGEKSYGSGAQQSVKGSNATAPEVQEVLSKEARLRDAVSDAKEREKKAKKKHDSAGEAQAHEDRLSAEAELAAKMPDLKAEEVKRKVAVGASATGTGHTPMPFDTIQKELHTGDWVYIDNGGAAGHSVIFVDWAGPERSDGDTAPEIGKERTVRWRPAHVYNQRKPELGGTYDTTNLGFPYSKTHHVSGVYNITRAREDAQVASTAEQFLSYDAGAARKSNAELMKKYALDPAALRARLLGVVRGVVAQTQGKKRSADAVGKVAGGFSEPQQKVIDGILAGSGDDEQDIADLVALGQKLSVIDIIHGDPTHPDGVLTQSAGTWSPPLPAWGKDASLRREEPKQAAGTQAP